MPGQQFSNSCIASSLLQEVVVFVLGHRDTATADDGDYDHFFVCQILGALKKGNHSNRP